MTVKQWEPESGFVEHYIGTVKDAVFTTDPRVRNGEVLFLALTNEVSAVDSGEGLEATTEHEDIEERFTCGSDWLTTDAGDTAEHPGGANRRFHRLSGMGALLPAVAALYSESELEGWDNRVAKSWVGRTFEWERFTEQGRDGKEYSRNLPVAIVDGAPSTRIESTQRAIDLAAQPTPEPEPNGDAPLADDIAAQLKTIADEASTNQQFMDMVVDRLPAVLQDATIVQGLSSGSLYTNLKGA